MPRNPRELPLTLDELAALTTIINGIEIPGYYHRKIKASLLNGMSISLLRLTQQYPYQVINKVYDVFENIATRLQNETAAFSFSDLISLLSDAEINEDIIFQHKLLDYLFLQIPELYQKLTPDLSTLVTLLDEYDQYKNFLIGHLLVNVSEYRRLISATVPFDYPSLYKLLISYPEHIAFFLSPISASVQSFCETLRLTNDALPELEFFIGQNPKAQEGLFELILNDMSLFTYLFKSPEFLEGNAVLTFLYCFPERVSNLAQSLIDDPKKYRLLITSPRVLFVLLDNCPEKTEQLLKPVFGDVYHNYSKSMNHMKKKSRNRDIFTRRRRSLHPRERVTKLCNDAYGNPYHYLYNAFSASVSIAKFSIFSLRRTNSEKKAILHRRGNNNSGGASAATLAVMNYFEHLDENVEMTYASLSS